jgi:hypothetical protein
MDCRTRLKPHPLIACDIEGIVERIVSSDMVSAMATEDVSGADWTDGEIDLIVADYFAMLRLDLLGEPYVKAQHNAALQKLIGRSRGSIEFKHHNISAVLMRLGEPWILGYKPKANFQAALIDGVARHFAGQVVALPVVRRDAAHAVREDAALYIGPPPALHVRNEEDPPALRRLILNRDPAARDARNRELGRLGEECVLRAEHARLTEAGRDDLARRVRWVAQEEGDGAGYDIRSFTPDGAERLIEVKTTAGYERTPFFLSENERAFSAERPDAFRLVRLFEFARAPRAFELASPLEASVLLRPAVHLASFG